MQKPDYIGLVTRKSRSRERPVCFVRRYAKDHSKPHIEGVVHHLLFYPALLLDEGKDGRDVKGTLPYECFLSLREHPGDIFIKAAACDMISALYPDAAFKKSLDEGHIYPGRSEKGVSQIFVVKFLPLL